MAFSASQVNTEEAIDLSYRNLFNLGGSNDPSLEELIQILDGIDDPFVQMVFILQILMPAMVKVKEDDLDELAGSLETLASYTNDMTNIQETFNELKSEDVDFGALATRLLSDIAALHDRIENEPGPLEPSLKAQITASLEAMAKLIESGGSTAAEQGKAIHQMWNPQGYWDGSHAPDSPYDDTIEYHKSDLPKEMTDKKINPHYNDMKIDPNGDPVKGSNKFYVYDHVWEWYHLYTAEHFEDLMDDASTMKSYLDDFNIIGTSVKSQSALTQALVEHDGSEYNAFIALNKDMFKEFHNQVQAVNRELKNM